ncbi:MAG: alpha-amylase family glycosyl hydrolase [Nitrospirales bacterium]|nr:alpha-amylase family glycosyl hydrolase [Nitrospirales bacterium]
MIEHSLQAVNLSSLSDGKFFPSPAAWEDQVLYFLLLDRFSDGQEKGYTSNDGAIVRRGSTPVFQPIDGGNAEESIWKAAGQNFCGGNLHGLTSKLGYLERLGVTAIWISPIFKQVSFKETYHGYGIQNFLDVDPHFGKRDDLRTLVRTAHAHGIYVILDIILNHTGDVFRYNPNRYWTERDGQTVMDPRWDGHPYDVQGFHDQFGEPTLPFQPLDLTVHPEAWPHGAVWPIEFQEPGVFTGKGHITNWDFSPEFLEGDFLDLKNIQLGSGDVDQFQPSPALKALAEVYKFWMAFADVDGYRVDTVKHMDLGASRYFASVIHEFAQSIGKENFYLIGEITGGRTRAFQTLETTGLDAALGIDDIPDKMEYLVKGYRNPEDYFQLFRNSILVQKESHVWFRNRVVTLFDDHDQVRKGPNKARFCAGPDGPSGLVNVLALNALTMGIPCIYYGSEQYFDGHGPSDQFIRECMFGGEFGAFQSHHRHFFNEESQAYQQLATILELRRKKFALRRGRQYLREISGNGIDFGLPRMLGGQIRSVIPWSRIFNDQEILLAINTDYASPRSAWVTIDDGLHQVGRTLTCLYSTSPVQIGQETTVEARNGKAVVLTLPAGGLVIYE